MYHILSPYPDHQTDPKYLKTKGMSRRNKERSKSIGNNKSKFKYFNCHKVGHLKRDKRLRASCC